MLKVPRLWTQQIVNLSKSFSAKRIHAVIYIGSDVVTLGIPARGAASGTQHHNQQAKKRLGSRSITSSLTQSLTLSHIHRILDQLESSAPITIILPAASFTRVSISAPADLAPQDIGPTLTWALQQQGFSPLSDWLWDATKISQGDGHAASYAVTLIETATVEGFLERLGIARKRLMMLIADSAATSSEATDISGPWLSDSQIQAVLSLLNASTIHRAPATSATNLAQTGLQAPVNLANNLVARVTTQYRNAFIQSATTLSALLIIGVAWSWQAMDRPIPVDTGLAAAPQATPLPVHPLFTHAHIWQQLHALNGRQVEVKRLEFRRNSWVLQIQAQNPGVADAWITELGEYLNLWPEDKPTELSRSPWRVLTSASRSDNGLTHIDLELHQ